MLCDFDMFPDIQDSWPVLTYNGTDHAPLGYQAPELVNSEAVSYSKASDSYAFGGLILEVGVSVVAL